MRKHSGDGEPPQKCKKSTLDGVIEDVVSRYCDGGTMTPFKWVGVDDMSIPVIERNGINYVSVRMVELKLLWRYPNDNTELLIRRPTLKSFAINELECRLLNEINLTHCLSEFGESEFTTNDTIVPLSDFIDLYSAVRGCYNDITSGAPISYTEAELNKKFVTGGWLFLSSVLIPYVRRRDMRFVPHVFLKRLECPVLEFTEQWPSSPAECAFLSVQCQTRDIDCVFGRDTKLLSTSIIEHLCNIEIVEVLEAAPSPIVPPTPDDSICETMSNSQFITSKDCLSRPESGYGSTPDPTVVPSCDDYTCNHALRVSNSSWSTPSPVSQPVASAPFPQIAELITFGDNAHPSSNAIVFGRVKISDVLGRGQTCVKFVRICSIEKDSEVPYVHLESVCKLLFHRWDVDELKRRLGKSVQLIAFNSGHTSLWSQFTPQGKDPTPRSMHLMRLIDLIVCVNSVIRIHDNLLDT